MPALDILIEAPSSAPGDPVVLHADVGADDHDLTITHQGLTEWLLNDDPVLFGTLKAQAFGLAFGLPDEASFGALTASVVEAAGANQAQVRHTYEQASVDYLYVLTGEDLTITTTLRNRGVDPIQIVGLTGLFANWAWPAGATGLMGMSHWGVGELDSNGLAAFHPSYNVPMGGTTRVAGPVGVGCAPIELGLRRSLIHWYGAWYPQFEGGTFTPNVTLYVQPAASGLLPGASFIFTFAFRVSLDTAWQHLLEPYRTQFQAIFGPRQYASDARPIVQNASADASHVGPGNPYGYHPDVRFDTVAGMDDWIATRMQGAVDAGCQGAIFWNLSGWDLRGLNYSPDVDLLPPETAALYPTLRAALEAEDLKVGRLGQPSFLRTITSWTNDGYLPVTANDPVQLPYNVAKYEAALAQGVTLYYLDTFGSTLEDIALLQVLRGVWGSTVGVYTEFVTDVGGVYAGFYREVDAPAYSIEREELIPVYQWLVPGLTIVVLNRINAEWTNADLDWAYARRYSALVQDWTFSAGHIARLVAHNGDFIDPGTHEWL